MIWWCFLVFLVGIINNNIDIKIVIVLFVIDDVIFYFFRRNFFVIYNKLVSIKIVCIIFFLYFILLSLFNFCLINVWLLGKYFKLCLNVIYFK